MILAESFYRINVEAGQRSWRRRPSIADLQATQLPGATGVSHGPKASERTSGFGESVIRGMTRLANQHGAINLAQGFPDFDPPEALLAALERAARGPHHQYAVTWGAPQFSSGAGAETVPIHGPRR